jgi:antitoxin component YwqK of YwqJK toxin-antitoxin module
MFKNNNLVFAFIFFIISCRDSRNKPNFITENYDNGKIYNLINSNDTMNSDRIYFYKSGEIFGFDKYKNGLKHGISIRFYSTGDMESQWNYYEGHPDGHCYNYGPYQGGYPLEFMIYNGEGKLVYRKIYDKTGKLIKTEGNPQ